MKQFVLRFVGEGATSAEDVQRLRSLANCKVIQESGKMVLVESDTFNEHAFLADFPGWISSPLRADIRIPNPRQRPNNPPK